MLSNNLTGRLLAVTAGHPDCHCENTGSLDANTHSHVHASTYFNSDINSSDSDINSNSSDPYTSAKDNLYSRDWLVHAKGWGY